jgi:Holliday junction resolvase RusA-like endonuclease
VLEGPPVPKMRARRGQGARWYTPEKTRRYERAVKELAIATFAHLRLPLRQGWPMNGRFYVEIAAHFPDARRRDADNVAKSVLDACNGVLWKDDCQVAHKAVPFVDRKHPRTEVHVELLQDLPQLVTHTTDPRSRLIVGNGEDALRELVRAADRAQRQGFAAQERELRGAYSALQPRLVAALLEDSRP